MRSLRLLQRLVAIVVVVAGTVVASSSSSSSQECEVGVDGSCLGGSNRDSIATDANGADPATTATVTCIDEHEKCDLWMTKGECEANPVYMLRNCRKSCETCGITDEDELDALAAKKLQLYEVGGDETLLETPYGITQAIGADADEEVRKVIRNFTTYMETIIFKDPLYASVRKTCKNRHADCAFWTSRGECEKNPVYMQKLCAPSCGTCHLLDHKFRCPLNETEPDALQPGDLNKLFERLVTEEYYQKYEPNILSMPHPTEVQKEAGVLDGPWVVVLEKLLTVEECDRLIDLGAIEGYMVSADVGKKNFDGTYDKSINSGRTSTNAWCTTKCYEDEVTKRVTAKIENITGIPEPNSEYLQLLRYEVGQFYQTHHDYIPHHTERQMGVRTLTVFLYLNDVEDGGGTDFPGLGIVVQPKKGRAVLWPSVFNDNPNAKDIRTEHGALPVKAGIKYGANAWLHQKNFKATMAAGCI